MLANNSPEKEGLGCSGGDDSWCHLLSMAKFLGREAIGGWCSVAVGSRPTMAQSLGSPGTTTVVLLSSLELVGPALRHRDALRKTPAVGFVYFMACHF